MSSIDYEIENKRTIRILLPEKNIQYAYSSIVWKCSRVLCKFIIKHKIIFHGKTVLEIGAGHAHPSMIAFHIGSKIVVSDCKNSIEECRHSLKLNLVEYDLKIIEYGLIDHDITTLPKVDIILASDIIYDGIDIDDIFCTLRFLLNRNRDTLIFMTYQIRNYNRNLNDKLRNWSLKAVSFDSTSIGLDDSFTESIEILLITDLSLKYMSLKYLAVFLSK